MRSRLLKLVLLCVIIVFLAGCVPGDGKHNDDKPAHFLWGVWHGWIAPVSLVIGIFKPGIRVYEAINNGWWYDFGFYIAIIGGFGGLSLTRNKLKGKHKGEE